jgi:hypothetical protein
MAKVLRGNRGKSGSDTAAAAQSVAPTAQKPAATAVASNQMPRKTGRKDRRSAARASGGTTVQLRSEDPVPGNANVAVGADGEDAAPAHAMPEVSTVLMQHQAAGQATATQSAPALDGFIDEANKIRIKGWARDPQYPDRPVELELMDGNISLARTTANQYRSDLRQAGIGDGRHAFTVLVGDGMLAADRNVLHLRCAATGKEVPGSPMTIERGATPVTAGRSSYEPVTANMTQRAVGLPLVLSTSLPRSIRLLTGCP